MLKHMNDWTKAEFLAYAKKQGIKLTKEERRTVEGTKRVILERNARNLELQRIQAGIQER